MRKNCGLTGILATRPHPSIDAFYLFDLSFANAIHIADAIETATTITGAAVEIISPDPIICC
ncbi:MAG: hypothetical protein ACPHL6_13395 [Rubripirellula sp.]